GGCSMGTGSAVWAGPPGLSPTQEFIYFFGKGGRPVPLWPIVCYSIITSRVNFFFLICHSRHIPFISSNPSEEPSVTNLWHRTPILRAPRWNIRSSVWALSCHIPTSAL